MYTARNIRYLLPKGFTCAVLAPNGFVVVDVLKPKVLPAVVVAVPNDTGAPAGFPNRLPLGEPNTLVVPLKPVVTCNFETCSNVVS